MPWISQKRYKELKQRADNDYKQRADNDYKFNYEREKNRSGFLHKLVFDLHTVSPEVRTLVERNLYGLGEEWNRANLDIVLEYVKRKGTDKRAKEILKQFEES